MAKEVGLKIRISSTGEEKVISNINDLENELQSLESTLKTLDFGSEAYKEATKDIGNLKSALRDVDKEIEGVDREQAFQAFSLAINGVTGAFLIATSAARTFGAEAETIEDVARAEQAALEAVNIALGVQAVAETIANAERVKATAIKIKDAVATRTLAAVQSAYNVAVGTSTGLLKAFRIALAATGVGLFVFGLVELISYLGDYIDEQKEANDAAKSFSETAEKVGQDISDEVAEIEVLVERIKDQTKSEKDRRKALDDLRKKYPNYFKDLQKDIDDTRELDRQKNLLIDSLVREARVRAAQQQIQKVVEGNIERRIKLQDDLIDAEEKLAKAREEANKASNIGATNTENFLIPTDEEYTKVVNQNTEAFEKFQKAQSTYLEAQNKVSSAKNEITKLNQEEEKQTKALTSIIDEQTAAIEKNGGATETNTENKEENKKTTEEQIKAEKDYQDALRASVDAFKNINFDSNASVQILDKANDIIEKQTQLLEKRNDILKTNSQRTTEFNQELKNLVGGLIIPDEGLIKIKDTFLDILSATEDEIIEKGATNAETQQKILENVIRTFKENDKLLGVEEIRKRLGDESLDTLLNFFQTSVNITDELDNYNKKLEGQDKIIEGIKNTNLDVFQLVQEIGSLQANRLNNLETEEETNFKIKELVSERLFNTSEIFNLTDNQKEILESITKTLIQQSSLYSGIFNVNKKLEELTGKINDNIKEQQGNLADTSGLEQFIKDNQDRIEEIDKFFSNLKAEQSNLTEEQIKQIQKLIDSIKLDKKRTEIVNNLQDIVSVIVEVFNELSGRLSSIFQRNNAILLEQLQQAEEQTLAIIGDNTERERNEQLKVQREFAKKRFDIEKKARIQELQFTLANSIAAGAQAVVQALGLPAPPPAPQLYAAAIAGLTGIELLTIRDQIRTAQSAVFVGRRGGMIQGGSHEEGGVPALLEGGEFVMSRPAVDRFGDIVGQLNQSVGGRGLQIDDSRIVQAISSQNSTKAPIKTYVLYNDIQNTDKLNKRIEKLSRL